jgi:hypothetical protein
VLERQAQLNALKDLPQVCYFPLISIQTLTQHDIEQLSTGPLHSTTIDNCPSEANPIANLGKRWISTYCLRQSDLFIFTAENQLPTVATGRPVRANRGGRIAQLQETSDLLGQGLAKKMTGAGSKRPRNQLDNAPESLIESAMAPPVKAKRRRVNKVIILL